MARGVRRRARRRQVRRQRHGRRHAQGRVRRGHGVPAPRRAAPGRRARRRPADLRDARPARHRVRVPRGLRVTTPEAMDVVRMVLTGQVSRELVGLINAHGPYAVGLGRGRRPAAGPAPARDRGRRAGRRRARRRRRRGAPVRGPGPARRRPHPRRLDHRPRPRGPDPGAQRQRGHRRRGARGRARREEARRPDRRRGPVHVVAGPGLARRADLALRARGPPAVALGGHGPQDGGVPARRRGRGPRGDGHRRPRAALDAARGLHHPGQRDDGRPRRRGAPAPALTTTAGGPRERARPPAGRARARTDDRRDGPGRRLRRAVDRPLRARRHGHVRPAQRVLVRGEGAYVWDADGKRYLDLLAGIAVNALGHAHPTLTAAVSAQLGTLGHVSNFFGTPTQIALAERLLALAEAPRGRACSSRTRARRRTRRRSR